MTFQGHFALSPHISDPHSNCADYLHEIMKLVAAPTPPVTQELVSDPPDFSCTFEEDFKDDVNIMGS